jgi:lantibiotic modifying enzyme
MRSEALEVAAELGHRIAGQAVWARGRCNWVGALGHERSRAADRPAMAALGPDLYEGTSGVALFLAEAAVQLDDERCRAPALGAIRLALEQAGRLGNGLFAGRLGVAYAATRVAALLEIEEVAAGARGLLGHLPGSNGSDVMSGLAGTLVGLAALDRLDGTALELGDELIARAHRDPDGWSWPSPGRRSQHNLCGYAHGAAGVGHALAELFGVTRDARYRDAAERAFAYERSWLDARTGEWADLRGIARRAGRDVPVPSAASWCNGAAGIALSRLRACALMGSPALRDDADLALAACERHVAELLLGAPEDFSLCHGAAGAGDVLLAGGRDELAAQVGRLGVAEGFPCGVPAGETPALMLGLSGVGMFYLRLADDHVATPLLVGLDTRSTAFLESGPPGEGAKP